MTTEDDMTPVLGSGNIYRDFGVPQADLRQFKALLAARILRSLEQRGLTVRAAQDLTGVNASEFSRIRQAKLARFTIERLADMLDRLGEEVELQVRFRSKAELSMESAVA